MRIGIIGLGYVGLPLAVYMARHFPSSASTSTRRASASWPSGRDRTGEVTDEEFAAARTIAFTADVEALRDCNFYIVTVPTPIDEAKRPDLTRADAGERDGRPRALAGRCGGLRIDGLSRRHGGGLRADPGEGVGAHLQPRFLRRLFA